MDKIISLRFLLRGVAALAVVLFLGLGIFGSPASAADPVIVVQGNSNRGSFENSIRQGFLSGITAQADLNLVSALMPKFWRISEFSNYQAINATGAKIKVVVSDLYARQKGGYANAKPWENWAEFEQIVTSYVQASLTQAPVDYWDVWNEPDGGAGAWQGTVAQFLEMLRRAHNAIRAVDPSAKIVAPSFAAYNQAAFAAILDYFVQNALHFNAISWHEFDLPESVPAHVAAAMALIAARPALGAMEIHVNEYSSGQNHLIPGWTVGWLYYLDQAEIQWATRACWERENSPGDTSECIRGLNGLLTISETSPQATYWVHRAYAAMSGTRLQVTTTDPKVVALAAKDDVTHRMAILVGRNSCGTSGNWCAFAESRSIDTQLPPATFVLSIAGYPYATVGQRVKISAVDVPYSNSSDALPAPTWLLPYDAFVGSDGSVPLTLTDFNDGEAMLLVIEPAV